MAKHKTHLASVWDVDDPRDVPLYTISEAAHYLSIPKATIRAWVSGTSHGRKGQSQFFRPVIQLPDKNSSLLSFFNLAEVHVLRGLRTEHDIRLPSIRKALLYVKRQFGWDRPLLQQDFKTDGVRLFVEQLGKLIDATAGGQVVFQEVMLHLDRLEWEDHLAARLYPFTRVDHADAPKTVIIDPRYSFGRPILTQSRIATAVIAERYKAGESISELASDYGCSCLEIEEGIRCELRLKVAA